MFLVWTREATHTLMNTMLNAFTELADLKKDAMDMYIQRASLIKISKLTKINRFVLGMHLFSIRNLLWVLATGIREQQWPWKRKGDRGRETDFSLQNYTCSFFLSSLSLFSAVLIDVVDIFSNWTNQPLCFFSRLISLPKLPHTRPTLYRVFRIGP